MKFLEKSLSSSGSGEQVKQAIACTFRNHAAALKSAATVRYVDPLGVDKIYFALNRDLNPLFKTADDYDDEVVVACLVTAGYRSGRDLTALENAVSSAVSAAAPIEKRDAGLREQARACGPNDAAKHAAIMAEISRNGPAIGAARDAVAKARAALGDALTADARHFIGGFEKRAAMLTAVSKWLYENAADKFAAIAAAADDAVRARAPDFVGRMLACIDEIAEDDAFPLNQKGRRCSCGNEVEDNILKAIKRPFNGGVGYRHTATGGTRYDVPMKSGSEVTITKVTD